VYVEKHVPVYKHIHHYPKTHYRHGWNHWHAPPGTHIHLYGALGSMCIKIAQSEESCPSACFNSEIAEFDMQTSL
jgi:hypothetical protein